MSIPRMIRKLLRKKLVKDSAAIYAGNMTKAVLGFFMGLIVARLLGPDQYGLFSLYLVVVIFCHSLVGEGLDAGVVRFFARYQHTEPERLNAVVGTALWLRLIIGSVLVLFSWYGADWFAFVIRVGDEGAWVIRLGVTCAFVASFTTFALALFQAKEMFLVYALFAIFVNLLRVISVPILVWTETLNLNALMSLHIIFFALIAALAYKVLGKKVVSLKYERGTFQEIWRFSRWTAVANLCFLLQVVLAVPFLTRFEGSIAAGIYAAGASLLLFIDQLTVAFLTVLLPRVSRFSRLSELRRYIRSSLPVLMGFALLLSCLFFLSDWLVELTYGEQFEESGIVLRILLIGFIATLLTHPLYLVLYSLNKPQAYAYTGICAVVVWVIAAFWLVPDMGVRGAAWAALAARVTQGGLIVVAVLNLVFIDTVSLDEGKEIEVTK